ncbi:hypothetical protein HYN59_05280 [Flavobacterium album]|uniref:OmpA-like domain-containing protein n=1 Tax=Flavobacterium album TaxID=2175091 RepID=A0A2S1QW07_9FLAO|nr:OmpA family protein [Flavobacterium album]AWH84566.1 hypothetical protein HYN59_05280 [Flavobacterium album]
MKKLFPLLLMLIAGLELHAQETIKAFTIYFDHDNYALSDKAKATLDSVAPYAKQFTGTAISSIGYTDDSGTLEYNKILAVNRANAAKDYLEAKGVTVGMTGGNIYHDKKPSAPERQRRAIITVKGNKATPSVAGCNFEQQEFTGPEGTVVIASVAKGSAGAVTVSEYYNSTTMLAGNMNAVDVNNNVLWTCGMMEICFNKGDLDPSGKFYTVKVPLNGKRKINRAMSIWLTIRGEDGVLRWENTSIQITSDTERKYYMFNLPVGTENCVKINLDASCVNDSECRVIHIVTSRPYNFHKLTVTDGKNSLSFSAKINDTLYAFTTDGDGNINLRNMIFTGVYSKSNKARTIRARLRKMKYTSDKYGLAHCYYLDKKARPVEEKGFWAWVRRQFRG